MEIADVKNHIKSGKFDKFYVFHGEEYAVMKIYINMMAEKMGAEVSYVDSLVSLVAGIRTKSLIENRHLYVILDDKEFMSDEKMWSKFTGLKDDVVVFYYTTTDKRLKFWKNFKDRAVEFPKLDSRILTKYVRKNAPFSDRVCEEIVEVCENDYGRILLEIDKVKAYSRAEAITADGAFEELLNKGIIYRNPKDAIFDFVDAFLERNAAEAYNLLEQSKAIGESNLALLSVMYNNVKTLLQVQSAKDYKSLGLNGFAIKNVIKHKNNYSNGELVKAMNLIREAEKGIKTGYMPEQISVDYVLVNVM